MTGKEQIKSFIREAEVYRDQGLFEQSKQKYATIKELVEKDERFSKDKSLIKFINDKIRMVDIALEEIETEPEIPELDENVQDLIGDLFSFSRNKDMAAIEGAVALAKFGQYGKALREFEKLIDSGTYPLVAAKNMLRCQITYSSPESAVAQFKRWSSRTVFTKMELKHLREFMIKLLKDEGAAVSEVSDSPDEPQYEVEEETGPNELLEICSVVAFLEQDIFKGKNVNLDVTCQIANNISCVIGPEDRDTIKALKPGRRLSRVQCFSQESVLITSALVLQRAKIMSGPKKGCYSFDLKLEGA